MSGVQPRHSAYIQPQLVRPSELPLIPASSVSLASSPSSTEEETIDWTFRESGTRQLPSSYRHLPKFDINTNSVASRGNIGKAVDMYKSALEYSESLIYKRVPQKVHFTNDVDSNFTFKGPIAVGSPLPSRSCDWSSKKSPSKKSPDNRKPVNRTHGIRVSAREILIVPSKTADLTRDRSLLPYHFNTNDQRRQSTSELTLETSVSSSPKSLENKAADKLQSSCINSEVAIDEGIRKKQRRSKTESSMESALDRSHAYGRTAYIKNYYHMSLSRKRDPHFLDCSLQDTYKLNRPIKKSTSTLKPKFSRSATLEWTHDGPSSNVPSSDWIESFTKQHGLASSSQHRPALANTTRSSLDNPRIVPKHQTLFKSPSAPAHDSNSRSCKNHGSTNCSFEYHPTDPIAFDTETRVVVHCPLSPSSEDDRKLQEKSNWSQKLGLTGSQFLSNGWSIQSRRSPTYPLISPSSHSTASTDPKGTCPRSPSSDIEMTLDLRGPVANFNKARVEHHDSTTSFSVTDWNTNDNPSTSTSNPVRRRIPVAKLHRSPHRSQMTQEAINSPLDASIVNSSGSAATWLSKARNQRAKLRKCRAFGKLYTTVKVKDDDVSVLVTTE